MTTVDLTEELKEFRNSVLKRMEKVDDYINKVDLEFMQLAFLASKESNKDEPQKEEEKFQENPDVVNSQMLDLLFKSEKIDYDYEEEEDDEDSETEEK